jgi:outer membrane protein TolC
MLEAQMTAAPEVLIAAAELDEKMSRLDHIQARSGLELRGNAGVGGFQELVGEDDTRDYSEVVVGGRLRYPLLGRYERQRVDIAKAEARTWESRHKLAMARLGSLKALRNHYIDYWGSTAKIDLSRAFLAKQQEVERIIGHRTDSGHMLEADRQAFLTTFSMARRSLARMQVIQHRSLRNLKLLTGPDLGPFSPQAPVLPSACNHLAALKSTALENHPDIQLYRSLVDEQLGILEMTTIGNLDAYVDLGGFASREDTASENEYGLALNLTVTLPAEIRRANRAERQATLAALRKAQLQLDHRSDQLLDDVEAAYMMVEAEKQGLQFARQRLGSALEGLREKLLRANRLPGDTLEQLEQARFQYYVAAIDLVDARMSVHRHQADLLTATASACQAGSTQASDGGPGVDSIINDNYLRPLWLQAMPEQPAASAVRTSTALTPPKGSARGYGAYVWDSRRLPFDHPQDTEFWSRLAATGIDRLLVSFDAPQLDALQRGKTRIDLTRFLETAREKNIRIDLLLGEPLWILPAYRQDLMAIIQQMADLPFSGLHLDLEPNQLDDAQYNEAYLLAQLVRTLQAAKRLSPWPVGLSIHPRYLDDARTDICLGCALTNIGLDELTLMVYVTSPQRVSQICRSIQKQFPGLSVSVAQSVEPILNADESYAGKGKAYFVQQMKVLTDAMQGDNFNGILIQSYSDFTDMQP